MKKVIFSLIAAIISLFGLSLAVNANTLDSVDVYLKYLSLDEALKTEQVAPTSISDAGEERINTLSGGVSYYSEELNLPGKNGFDLVIGRRFNSDSGADLYGKAYYVTVKGYRTSEVPDVDFGKGEKYVFPYYTTSDFTGEPIFIAYESIGDMLVAEDSTASITVPEDYADYLISLTQNADAYNWINSKSVLKKYQIGFDESSEVIFFEESLLEGTVELYRKASAGYNLLCSSVEHAYIHEEGMHKTSESLLQCGWEYTIPKIIAWDWGEDKQANTECQYGMFYDPQMKTNVTIRFRYDGSAFLDACCNTEFGFYEVPYDEQDLYCIKAKYEDGDFIYYIRRYDGVKFHFINDVFQYMEDRFGNRIDYSYSTDLKTITINDTLNREIVLSPTGITVNGVDKVKYSFVINNNDIEDPNDILGEDETAILTASYQTASNVYKQITYTMSQRPKVYYVYNSPYEITHSVAFSKAVINDITLQTGGKRCYIYDDVTRYTYTSLYVEDPLVPGNLLDCSAYHAYRQPGCIERYDTQPQYSHVANHHCYSYGEQKSKPSTTMTIPEREGYSVTETYNLDGNLTKRVTTCTDLDYTLTEDFTYIFTNRMYLLSRKKVTKEASDGSALSYSESYSYNSQNNLLTQISRDSKTIYKAEYADFGLPLYEYSIFGEDDYRGFENTVEDGNITEKIYITKTSLSADSVEKEAASYTYDEYGNLSSFEGDGVYVEYTYEYGDYSNGANPAYSIIIHETYPTVDNITNSQGVEIPSANVTKSSYYDKWGNLVKTVDGEGNITTYTYDYLGRLLKITNPDNSTQIYSYNDTTNRIYFTDENGKRYMTAYDTLGNEGAKYFLNEEKTLWKLIYHNQLDRYSTLRTQTIYNGNGAESTLNYTYYSDNSLKTEILKNKSDSSVISQNTYEYTILDNDLYAVSVTRKKTDTENVIITNYTNQYGFKVKDTISDGSDEVEQVYTTDAEGNITEVVDFRGITAHEYTYDYRGRVLKDTLYYGSTTNVYDGAYLYQVKDALSNVVKTYEYNTRGQLIRETTPVDDDTDNVTEYYYDRNGNLTKTVTTTGDGTTTKAATTSYDNRNRPVAVNDGSGYYTRYEYDKMANVTRMATGVPTITETLDRNTHSVTDYEYSFQDFLVKVTDPMGYTESYTYNGRGTMLTSTDKNGTVFTYTYNGAPWLLSKTATGTNGDTQSITYAYDYLGNITQTVDESGTTVYTYDKLGNVLTENNGTLVKTYGYDNNGNRTSANITDGTFSHSTTYTYDNNNRLTKATGDDTNVRYTYDNNNRVLTQKSYLNSSSTVKSYTVNTYYDGGLLKTKKNYRYSSASTSRNVDNITLTYYADGNIATVDNKGVVTGYVYDSAGRLLSESIDGAVQASYTYDAFGNRATKTEPDRVTTYAYTKSNRLGNAITQGDNIYLYHYYAYDRNGNLQEDHDNGMDHNYQYDLFGNLVRAYTRNNVTIATYTYDGNGIRTSKTVDNVTTSFINDGAYVVGEVCGDSVIKYAYGNGLASINNNGTIGFYHTDEHGNISAVSDKSYNLLADYDFDAFGNEIVSTDTYYNPMRYCGEYFDDETGLIYLRARYYDPTIGRFISEDPHWNLDNMIYGDENEESNIPNIAAIRQATNGYVYCGNNPIKYIDPAGGNWVDVVRGFFDGIARYFLPKDSGYEYYDEYEDAGDYYVSSWMGSEYAEFVSTHDFVFDVSVSAGNVTVGYSYIQGNASNYTAGYVHVGYGRSVSLMPYGVSFSLGIVNNATKPEDYAGDFVDISAALGIGVDGCGWVSGTNAISITVTTNASAGIRYDYYMLVHSEVDGQDYYDLYKKK